MSEHDLEYLFVYGSLRVTESPSERAHPFLPESFHKQAKLGYLKDYCAKKVSRFAAVVPEKGSIVPGQIFPVTKELLQRLDAYEHVHMKYYERVKAKAYAGPLPQDSFMCDVWVYQKGANLEEVW